MTEEIEKYRNKSLTHKETGREIFVYRAFRNDRMSRAARNTIFIHDTKSDKFRYMYLSDSRLDRVWKKEKTSEQTKKFYKRVLIKKALSPKKESYDSEKSDIEMMIKYYPYSN